MRQRHAHRVPWFSDAAECAARRLGGLAQFLRPGWSFITVDLTFFGGTGDLTWRKLMAALSLDHLPLAPPVQEERAHVHPD
jgi:hypothetical protein